MYRIFYNIFLQKKTSRYRLVRFSSSDSCTWDGKKNGLRIFLCNSPFLSLLFLSLRHFIGRHNLTHHLAHFAGFFIDRIL